ncbi:NapC/NirT family cytochrome c [Dehalobacterium formicoaceticum]|uniref:NapC/NirT family cytochrome c n=1 Tax=Dehalobacterium formicoaceticum TaxID=51515 RepID=UPI000B7D7A6D|nr:NapC/NirT family cytochrome c [Dehalobacterium formicoaceticum]
MKKKIGMVLGILVVGFGLILLTKLPILGLDEPEFCGGCHVMDGQLETYMHSAHRDVTNCGNCHIPHSLVPGATYKAYTGTKDLIGVVFDKDPYHIQASPMAKDIIQENCLRCHEDFLGDIGDTSEDGGKYCFDCHRSTPHMK